MYTILNKTIGDTMNTTKTIKFNFNNENLKFLNILTCTYGDDFYNIKYYYLNTNENTDITELNDNNISIEEIIEKIAHHVYRYAHIYINDDLNILLKDHLLKVLNENNNEIIKRILIKSESFNSNY